MTDADLARILTHMRVVACVGFSANPARPSHQVAGFLAARGLTVIPVNPGLAGQSFLGQTAVARLADVPPTLEVDCVDIFRRSEEAGAVVDEALAALPRLSTVWMQLGVRDDAAAARAMAQGVAVVMDRCPKIEIARLSL